MLATHHSPPSSAEMKNELSYNFTLLICLYGADRDNFTFTTVWYMCVQLVVTYNSFYTLTVPTQTVFNLSWQIKSSFHSLVYLQLPTSGIIL